MTSDGAGDRTLTKAIPFTAASLACAIRGIEKAGKFAIGVKPDGTLIIGDKPIDVTSLVPVDAPTSKWEDKPAKRFGDSFSAGAGEARRPIDYFDPPRNRRKP
jgi:hypothetical protein